MRRVAVVVLASVATALVSGGCNLATAEELGRFSGLARIVCASGQVGYAAAVSEDLPGPGWENRWHLLLSPEHPIPCLTARAATLTTIGGGATSRGSYFLDFAGWGLVELVPGWPQVRAHLRRVAPVYEARRQTFSIRAIGDGIEILIEEPRR